MIRLDSLEEQSPTKRGALDEESSGKKKMVAWTVERHPKMMKVEFNRRGVFLPLMKGKIKMGLESIPTLPQSLPS